MDQVTSPRSWARYGLALLSGLRAHAGLIMVGPFVDVEFFRVGDCIDRGVAGPASQDRVLEIPFHRKAYFAE